MRTQCPFCKGPFNISEENKGKTIPCELCGQNFKAAVYEAPDEKYNKAVNNLWIATGLSVVNLILILAGSSWNFAFSLWGSEILCEFGGVGVAFAIILLIVYCVLAFLSKTKPALFILAFVLVCLDTLIGGLLSIFALMGEGGSDFIVSAIIGFAFHGWLLWEMGKGLAASRNIQ